MNNFQGPFKILSEQALEWYELVIKYIPNVLVAFVILLIFIKLAKYLKETLQKFLPKIIENKSIKDLISSLGYIIVILIGGFSALEILGLEKTVTSILAGAGVFGLALGFAFQEIASNFVSGVMIALKEPYKLGDIVEVDGHIGEVTLIELRTTCITTFQGLEIFIPNKDMFTKSITNYTSTPKRRVDINVGVTYDSDLEFVEGVARESLKNLNGRIPHREVDVLFYEFGDSSINLSVQVWIHFTNGPAFFNARHEAIMAIKKAFDQNQITIPFPIRTLDIPNFSLPLNKEMT